MGGVSAKMQFIISLLGDKRDHHRYITLPERPLHQKMNNTKPASATRETRSGAPPHGSNARSFPLRSSCEAGSRLLAPRSDSKYSPALELGNLPGHSAK